MNGWAVAARWLLVGGVLLLAGIIITVLVPGILLSEWGRGLEELLLPSHRELIGVVRAAGFGVLALAAMELARGSVITAMNLRARRGAAEEKRAKKEREKGKEEVRRKPRQMAPPRELPEELFE
jgi:hypothetical protein